MLGKTLGKVILTLQFNFSTRQTKGNFAFWLATMQGVLQVSHSFNTVAVNIRDFRQRTEYNIPYQPFLSFLLNSFNICG